MILGIIAGASLHALTTGNLLVNPSADSGTTGWTQTQGANFTTGTGHVAGATHDFIATSNGSLSHINQVVNVPAGWASRAADGIAEVVFEFEYVTLGSDEDRGRARIICWSGAGGSGNILGVRLGGALTANTTTLSNLTMAIPAGTQSISVGFVCYRDSGTELSFYWSHSNMYLQDGTIKVLPVYAREQPDSTGWTVTTGTFTSCTSASAGPYGLASHFGGSQAALAYNEVFSADAAQLAMIATGSATLELRILNWATNDSDQSRFYVECLDASDVVLATCNDNSAVISWGAWNTANDASRAQATYTVAVPVGTTKFKVRQQFTRVDGTVNDAHTSQVSVVLTTPV